MTDQAYRLTLRALHQGQTLTLLVRGAVLVGRSDVESNHVPDIDLKSLGAWNAGVSRRHLVMNPFEDESFFVKDLGSPNGTRINGSLLKAGMIYSLQSGDELTVGTLRLEVSFTRATTAEIQALQLAQTEVSTGVNSSCMQVPFEELAVPEHVVRALPRERSIDPNATIVRHRPALRQELPEETAQADTDHLTPDEREAVNLLSQIGIRQEISESAKFYMARDATRNAYWRSNRRIAVLQAACNYGYIPKDHAELMQEQHRMNQRHFGGAG